MENKIPEERKVLEQSHVDLDIREQLEPRAFLAMTN